MAQREQAQIAQQAQQAQHAQLPPSEPSSGGSTARHPAQQEPGVAAEPMRLTSLSIPFAGFYRRPRPPPLLTPISSLPRRASDTTEESLRAESSLSALLEEPSVVRLRRRSSACSGGDGVTGSSTGGTVGPTSGRQGPGSGTLSGQASGAGPHVLEALPAAESAPAAEPGSALLARAAANRTSRLALQTAGSKDSAPQPLQPGGSKDSDPLPLELGGSAPSAAANTFSPSSQLVLALARSGSAGGGRTSPRGSAAQACLPRAGRLQRRSTPRRNDPIAELVLSPPAAAGIARAARASLLLEQGGQPTACGDGAGERAAAAVGGGPSAEEEEEEDTRWHEVTARPFRDPVSRRKCVLVMQVGRCVARASTEYPVVCRKVPMGIP
jgi:hypothetical protein